MAHTPPHASTLSFSPSNDTLAADTPLNEREAGGYLLFVYFRLSPLPPSPSSSRISRRTPSPPPSPRQTPPISRTGTPTIPHAAPHSPLIGLAAATGQMSFRPPLDAEALNRRITSNDKMLNCDVPRGIIHHNDDKPDIVESSTPTTSSAQAVETTTSPELPPVLVAPPPALMLEMKTLPETPETPAVTKMPGTAHGVMRSDGNNIVGSFDIEGTSYHLTIDAKPLFDQFECSNATLKYGSFEKLIEGGSWSGTVGKTNLRIANGKDITINGPFDTSRLSSVMVRGTGIWTSQDQPGPVNGQQDGDHASICSLPRTPVSFDMDENPFKLARERNLLESGDPIILIFGQTGTGKSTFINLIASEQQKVGNGLRPCTSEISVLQAMVGGRRIVIIDTPGIDDTRVGMKDFITDIAHRLKTTGEQRVWVTGVLFMHRISDNKFPPSASRIANTLESLCGDAAMSHVMLCTTMWDEVSPEEGEERFIELCETRAWKRMVNMGAKTSQISCLSSDAKAEAENIISELIKNAEPVELAIQDEMVNQHKTMVQTGAGRVYL